jgi:hypothetical protein
MSQTETWLLVFQKLLTIVGGKVKHRISPVKHRKRPEFAAFCQSIPQNRAKKVKCVEHSRLLIGKKSLKVILPKAKMIF